MTKLKVQSEGTDSNPRPNLLAAWISFLFFFSSMPVLSKNSFVAAPMLCLKERPFLSRMPEDFYGLSNSEKNIMNSWIWIKFAYV